MQAVSCRDARLEVVELPAPTPSKGQLLLDVLRCGICGSDLHARHHCDELADVMAESGYDAFMRSEQDVVFGHEFCGEIVEHGPGTRRRSPTGTAVVAMPLLRRGRDVHAIGLSAQAPGAYAEQVLVEESLAVPRAQRPGARHRRPSPSRWPSAGMPSAAVEVKKGTVAVVIGCGPVGLAVISMLKAQGVRTVVASDFSRGRRALATACGADVVVDPASDSPFGAIAGHGHLDTVPDALELALDDGREAPAAAGPVVAGVAGRRGARRQAQAAR